MNGINPKPYDQFWKTWHMVTVRFRKDNGEQRFIYANPTAWKAMQRHVEKYPKGSMFAKLAFTVKADPLFPNSLSPARTSRVQFMKKDEKKYASTEGWGYALYVPSSKEGNRGGTENAADPVTCYGCHTLAKERDFVFGQDSFASKTAPAHSELDFRSKFELKGFNDLPAYSQAVIRAAAPSSTNQKFKYYSMPLFLGSLHESVGPLGEFAAEDQLPYLLADATRSEFLLVLPEEPNPECPHPAKVVIPLTGKNNDTIWRFGHFCSGRNRWYLSQPAPREVASFGQPKH